MNRVRRVSFAVRVVQGSQGQVSGVIERVATGAKEAFSGIEAIGRVITWMLQVRRPSPQSLRTPRHGRRRGADPMERATTDCEQAGLSTSRRR
jgi:hypothetical protein